MQQEQTKSVDDALTSLAEKGWAKVENVYESQLIEDVKEEFYRYESAFIEIQTKKRYHLVENATHHSFVICRDMLKGILGLNPVLTSSTFSLRPYILNTMGLSRIVPQGKVYTQNIHRDVRSFHGANRLWINTLILLDDTDSENGATWIWEGSQHFPDKPSDEDFYNNAIRIEAKRAMSLSSTVIYGTLLAQTIPISPVTSSHLSILSHLSSNNWITRRPLEPTFVKPAHRILRQLLGYNARVPRDIGRVLSTRRGSLLQKDQGMNTSSCFCADGFLEFSSANKTRLLTSVVLSAVGQEIPGHILERTHPSVTGKRFLVTPNLFVRPRTDLSFEALLEDEALAGLDIAGGFCAERGCRNEARPPLRRRNQLFLPRSPHEFPIHFSR